MTSDRIKEIQLSTAYPDSVSVKQALLQVWNECEQSTSDLTTEVTRLREAAKQKYLDGFTEGYQMAIEDIQEGNPLNKVYKSNKLDFYKKLLAKLDLITSGELNLVDYKSEVVNKVQTLTPST